MKKSKKNKKAEVEMIPVTDLFNYRAYFKPGSKSLSLQTLDVVELAEDLLEGYQPISLERLSPIRQTMALETGMAALTLLIDVAENAKDELESKFKP